MAVGCSEMLVRIATELKHILNSYLQSSGDHECYLQGWRVAIGLNGNNRLARDAYAVCKVQLRDATTTLP